MRPRMARAQIAAPQEQGAARVVVIAREKAFQQLDRLADRLEVFLLRRRRLAVARFVVQGFGAIIVRVSARDREQREPTQAGQCRAKAARFFFVTLVQAKVHEKIRWETIF